jgi:hypothetical protein
MTTLLIGVVLLLGSLTAVLSDTFGIAAGSVGAPIAVGTTAPDGPINPEPEPWTLATLGLGLLALGFVGRRRSPI